MSDLDGMRLLTAQDLLTVGDRVTPRLLAQMFSVMHSDEQAEFFNSLAVLVSDWFPMQLQWITDDEGLTDEARMLMSQIGEYAYPEEKDV